MRNLFKRFSDITGRKLRTVGTCIAVNYNECTIQYPGGSVTPVTGAGVQDTRYFVLDNKLDGEAPDLVSLTIEV
jgi:hypothetical protein